MTTRHLFLAASITGAGTSPLAARWPGTRPHRFAEWDHFREAAETARRGVLDAVFHSDFPAHHGDSSRAPGHVFDPLVVDAAIAGAVPDIGFILTASTSYNAPFNLARRTATLDHVSGGRTILNLVTNFAPAVAGNFGDTELLARPDRYRKADEFVAVLKKLWGSFQLGDPGTEGPLWSAETAQPIDHHGEFFDVTGPLNVPAGKQGHPVLAQAGASGPGLDFAARNAEVVYAALLTVDLARQFRDDLGERLKQHGRSLADVRLVPGVNVVLGIDDDDARRRWLAYSGFDSEEDMVAAFLHDQQGWGTGGVPVTITPDTVLEPEWFRPSSDQTTPVGFAQAVASVVASRPTTARELVRLYGNPGGHRLLVGSPETVAQGLADWWQQGVVDGFVVHFPVLPDDLERFVDQVVPILQTNGVTPASYAEAGATIRDRLGLPLPF